MARQVQKPICTRQELNQVSFLVRQIQFKKQPTSAIIFVFEEQVYAYVNHCMHMQRPLNCEQEAIFDETV
jgi:nitrite reductase/ring-hydroxylating ferredoxin subunit